MIGLNLVMLAYSSVLCECLKATGIAGVMFLKKGC